MKKNYDVALRGHHLRLLYSFYFLGSKNLIWDIAATDHSWKHADNTIKVLKRITNSNIRIKITDTIDDICKTCDNKRARMCREFIPYDVSAAASDRETLHSYRIKLNRVYTSKFLLKRLKKMGPQVYK